MCSLKGFFPVFHAFQVLGYFFVLVYVFLHFSHSHFSTCLPSTPSPKHYQPFPSSSVCQSLDSIPVSFFSKHFLPKLSLTSPRSTNFLFSLLLFLAGDINLNPGPSTISSTLKLSHLNIRSATTITPDLNKPASLQEFITDNSISFLSLTETWLSSNSLPSSLNSLTPSGYSILSSPRHESRGGGIAIIFDSLLKIHKLSIPSFPSFESLCVKLSFSSVSFTILTVYRPPTGCKSAFLSDFSTLLEDLATSPSDLLVTGDFNFHFDQPTDSSVSSFLSLLDTFDLIQHVDHPTHQSGHILDLLISRKTSSSISSVFSINPHLSDHSAVMSVLNIPALPRSPRITKLVRNFKSIDIASFSNDILSSSLYTAPVTSLDAFVSQFHSTLSTLLDKHAPAKRITCSSNKSKPFITKEIRQAKSLRSKLESKFRKNKTSANKELFKQQTKVVNKLISQSRKSYYRNLIVTCADQPKKLWAALDSLLSRKLPSYLPSHTSAVELASAFLDFFNDKISKLCLSLPNSSQFQSPHIPLVVSPPTLSVFTPATNEEVRRLILSSSNATCSLDVIPTHLLKSCIDCLVSPITTLINLSLSEGKFPDQLKAATVTPLLKKHSLPHDELNSYRPISNLNFISKILERVIHSRISSHLQSFPSLSPFQSAYRKFHSTETALLRIYNDLLLSIDKQQVSALVLLDLSAAFDTIDHQILLTRLNTTFGLSDAALSVLSSYLIGRTQQVTVSSEFSASSTLTTGVPQGSVLGPLLFSMYTSPLSNILNNTSVCHHLYADDTQLYISFSAKDSSTALHDLSSALDSVYVWLTSNRLFVNPSKTEYLLIGTPQQRSKVISNSISFRGTPIVPSNNARNLGVIFDSHLTFRDHVSKVCQSSFYQIRQLRQIRSSLDINSATVLSNSLVTSKLDYCNSLLYGLPASSIARLQRVQNSLARVVYPSVRKHHHISPTLQKLHWLPIKQRITYKIAVLCFKTIYFKQPTYLLDLITTYQPTRNLRSSDKVLLSIPNIKSAQGRRSFSHAAPTVWNSLPLVLRSCSTISSFRSGLKTHLFPP